MAEESKRGNVNKEHNVAVKGLNLDSSQNNIEKGILSYALNATVENFDANSIQYQNEPGNTPCFDFPEGFKLIGKYFIPEKAKIIFWIKNEETSESEIGYMVNNDCIYRTLINSSCLNFDINRPILSAAHRILDNGDIELYWADNNGRRYLNINDIPYIPLTILGNCNPKDSKVLDCNALLFQPELSIPITSVKEVVSGGEITSGTYQFTVQYSDADGNPYTAYYNVTNPLPISDVELTTVNFNTKVGKSIVINISNLDPYKNYEYFNLAVIKTINNIPSVELVGTYFIDDYSKQITYTGQSKTDIRLTVKDIFEKFAFYEGADYVTAVQDILVWKGMHSSKRINYQKIANDITLKWQTYRLPPSDDGYANELNAGNLRGYLRDEVYAFEIVFLLKNGKETDAFHIPGRIKGQEETSSLLIETDNKDYIGDGINPSEVWEVYNTAKVEGYSNEFLKQAVEETVTIDYCTYELRQGGPDPSLGKNFNVEYVNLEGIITTILVTQPIQYIDSVSVPIITSGQGFISEIRCDSIVSTTVIKTAEDYKGPYQYGKFGYWESTEEYPCNEEVWGKLAGQRIRHHKFPDCRVSPIIEDTQINDSLEMKDVAIFPIGVLINSEQIQSLIERSDLTSEQKQEIVGYKITRANRGVNKSIIAKGMLRNVNKYKREEQEYYYPNYPYNDVDDDPFLNYINNAWSQQCEEYTIEIYNVPLQENGTTSYVSIEYISCDNNKPNTQKWTEPGTYKVCSINKPVFNSEGIYNTMNHSNSGSTPKEDTDAIVYPSNYDIHIIGWRVDTSAGMRVEWNDIVTGVTTQYLCCPGGGFLAFFAAFSVLGLGLAGVIVGIATESLFKGPTLLVRTPAGEKPSCVEYCHKTVGGKNKFESVLLSEVRTSNCSSETSMPKISDNIDLLDKQIFNSPETSFGQPFLGNILSLETVMYGSGKAHFVDVEDNAKYRLITKEAQIDALKAAEKVAALTQDFSLEAMFAVYNANLTIFRNEITKRNFAKSFNSIASYNYSKPVPINLGIKNRNLDSKRYLIPEVLDVGEDININNFNRESSVYLKATESIPLPNVTLETYHNKNIKDNSRFTISEKGKCSTPDKEETISVVSYYGALKNRFVNQYGQIYSYESIDTGFVRIFNNESSDNTIWGGDTYIGRFAYKTKLPFFIDNRVNFPDDSDIFYDEIGNVGYPKYWHSSRSVLETWQGEIKDDLRLTNFLSYKAHNFDCPNNQDIEEDQDPSVNPNRTFYDGYFYMFAYGVPSFYCESSYNLDLRTAFNNKEGDFWPHVSNGIPDNWLQETNVPIVQDNTYNYNVTFSKQNKESVITNLPANWDISNEIDYYPFRAVYSDKQISNVNNRLNNWLVYRPLSYFDFPQNYGNLTALDSLQNSAILARFENKSLLYNSLVTINTSNPQAAYVGNDGLFSNQPIDFADTDQGYIGAQNKVLLKTPYGALSIDAKRGHIFLINGSQAQDLTQFGSGMHRWFTAHLPFEISKYFPGIDTDNHFKGIGIHGVFDSNYERVIITKLDYIPLSKEIEYKNNKFYITENGIEKEIYLIDSDYFCNVSWTISFNFNTKSWLSFHSYIPNWYVGENNFFYSGLNYCPNDFDVLVGIKDSTLPTTTTTTTNLITTTTTTTIPMIIYDCGFDVIIETPDCAINGTGVFVNDPIIAPCTRPINLVEEIVYSGYIISTIPYDSTISNDAACTAISYYYLVGSIPDLEMTFINVKVDSIVLGGKIFLNDGSSNCTYPADGWYFTGETAGTDETSFRVVSGEIVEWKSCDDITDPVTTTTTTTTVLPTTPYCFVGIYTSPDPLHPLGGVIIYEDELGVEQVIGNIWDVDTININASIIISTSGVTFCP